MAINIKIKNSDGSFTNLGTGLVKLSDWESGSFIRYTSGFGRITYTTHQFVSAVTITCNPGYPGNVIGGVPVTQDETDTAPDRVPGRLTFQVKNNATDINVGTYYIINVGNLTVTTLSNYYQFLIIFPYAVYRNASGVQTVQCFYFTSTGGLNSAIRTTTINANTNVNFFYPSYMTGTKVSYKKLSTSGSYVKKLHPKVFDGSAFSDVGTMYAYDGAGDTVNLVSVPAISVEQYTRKVKFLANHSISKASYSTWYPKDRWLFRWAEDTGWPPVPFPNMPVVVTAYDPTSSTAPSSQTVAVLLLTGYRNGVDWILGNSTTANYGFDAIAVSDNLTLNTTTEYYMTYIGYRQWSLKEFPNS